MPTPSKVVGIKFERCVMDFKSWDIAANLATKIITDTNWVISRENIFEALMSLHETHPHKRGHAQDMFEFRYNGNSFSLLWEPATYNADIGEVICLPMNIGATNVDTN